MSSMQADCDSPCVARQPILDRQGRVFGYELLYREQPDAQACTRDGDTASSRVLTDTFLAFGQGELTEGRPAFVNFSRALLLSGGALLATPEALIIEVLETVHVDEQVLEVCRELNDRGYALGLDDFVPGSEAEALLPYAKFVKIDVQDTSHTDVMALIDRFRPTGIKLIAEKVESGDVAAAVFDRGCHFVQGFHFCRPTTFSRTPLPTRQLMYLKLLSALGHEMISVRELENVIKHDPSLTVQILRAVNSSATGVRHEVTSIAQALMLLGRDRVRKWAAVLTLAGMNTMGTSETVVMALLRARCCEIVGTALGGADTGYFLLGLCSLLDAIVGRPMETVIADLPLPPMIAEALLGGQNPARTLLDAVICYEQGDWDGAATALSSVNLPFDNLPTAYADALRWAHELSRLE